MEITLEDFGGALQAMRRCRAVMDKDKQKRRLLKNTRVYFRDGRGVPRVNLDRGGVTKILKCAPTPTPPPPRLQKRLTDYLEENPFDQLHGSKALRRSSF
jgi:hypothetical protein